MKKEFNMLEQLWVNVYLAVSGSSNCTDIDTPEKWADRAVSEFKKRFPCWKTH
jgi:hypothetical protein